MRISLHLACVTWFRLGRSLPASSPNFRAREGIGSFLEPYFLCRGKSIRPLCISSHSSHASASYFSLKARVDEPEQKIANKDVAPADRFGGIPETGEQVVELEKHNEALEQHNKELEKRNREMERRMKALEQELATANTDAAKLRRQLDKALAHRNQDLKHHQDILRLEIDSFKNSFASKGEWYQKQLRNRDELFSRVDKAVKEIRDQIPC